MGRVTTALGTAITTPLGTHLDNGHLLPWAMTKSVNLDGSTMYVDASGAEQSWSNIAAPYKGTFGAWVKADSDQAGLPKVFGFGVAAGAPNNYPTVAFQVYTNRGFGRATAVDDAGTLDPGSGDLEGADDFSAWVHVAIALDEAGTGTIWTDGSSLDTYSLTGWSTFDNLASALLGALGLLTGPAQFLDCHLAEWWFAPGYVADSTEVTALYNGGTPTDPRAVSGVGDAITEHWIASNALGTSTVTFKNIGRAPLCTVATLVNGDSTDLEADVPS